MSIHDFNKVHYLFLSLLHKCCKDKMLASHKSSNSAGFPLYSGNWSSKISFISTIPSKRRAGKLAQLSGEQPRNTSSPKMLNCASLQAKHPILDTLMRSALQDKINFTGISLLLSIGGGLQGLAVEGVQEGSVEGVMTGWSEEEGRGEHGSNGEGTTDRGVEGRELVGVLGKNV